MAMLPYWLWYQDVDKPISRKKKTVAVLLTIVATVALAFLLSRLL